ncbi:MAG: ABC transporter permease [Erysipelotrichales bacterium]|nr:ABC transporter permease [Erysipelotrichales bacterium]
MAKNIDEVVEFNTKDLFTVVGNSDDEAEKLESTPYSYWGETFKQLWKNPLTIICIAIIILIVIMAFVGPLIKQYKIIGAGNKTTFDTFENYLPPSADHFFGTAGAEMKPYDGQDLWTLVWKGTQLSLLLGTVVALIDTFFGIIIGSMWGYFKWLDPILIELRNFINTIPSILLYILLMQFLEPSFWTIVLVLCMFGWMGLAGFIRNQIIIIRNREYNIASQTLGSSSKAMITHNLLPYLISVIVTVISTAIPGAISSEVGLAYFNLSFKADDQVTLGQVLTLAAKDNWIDHIYLLLAPMVVMAPLTICFFYLGLALADATDPKNHR